MANSFTRLPLWAYLMTLAWMSLLATLSFVEDPSLFQQVPMVGGYLSYANTNWRFVIQILFGAIMIIHIGEALYAGYLAMSSKMSMVDTIKWVLQTGFLGIPSLNMLKKTCKEMKKSS